eukprot:g14407.t1
MLSRLKTAAQGSGSGTPGSGSSGSSSVDVSGKWGRRGGGRPAERDQFRVQQQGFYIRGGLTVDVFQARGLRLGTAGERNPYCVVLVERVKVGETPTAAKTLSPVWNHPVKVSHENVRRAADTNVWPVPYQPLSVQVWDRSSTSDTLLGTARIPIAEVLGNGDGNGWYKLVGTGDQVGIEEVCGKIRVKVYWESEALASTPEDYPRLFLRDVFGPERKDYQHLYYGGRCSTMLCPPAGEEVLLEMMLGISRHDITANNHGKGVEGMLVLTELRLLFLPDIDAGSTTASFLEFNTVQVYLAAVRNFSHRGLEGGDRLLSITTRDGRFVHFRMPASASAARCAAWFEAECPQPRRRRAGNGAQAATSSGSGREELWKRGLWGAGNSELWMERLVDEIRWRKASGDFVALWHKLRETSATPRAATAINAAAAAVAQTQLAGGGGGFMAGGRKPTPSQYHQMVAIGAASTSASRLAAAGAETRGDLADGRAALERDLERVGVPAAGGGGGANYAAFGRQMWEFKPVNKNYALSSTYPQALAFPSSITPAQLATAAPQRSRSRMPALVWLHPASKAPLCRSSQPMAGMTTKVLSEDIYLLKQIRVTLDASKISIVDARSLLNAKANQVTGKGYEDVNDIGRDVCTLGFMGIENIHAVRDSLAAFCAASQAQGQEYYHAVGASGWLRHLAQIMKGAAFVVDELQRGVAVLVHCSDGWDRTAQLTALAQLYMDPYYRTLAGFEVLVEKEWCSFGHMFGLRAHSDSPTESSPVFLQWLDAVWQLVRQYPSSFEFTGHYLERLVEGVYSAGFLNFAGNCERERREKLKELQDAGSGALSLFAYLREHAMEGHMTAPLLNPLYRPPAHVIGAAGRAPSVRAVDILRPCCELQGLEIWQSVYMRDNLLLHHREQQLSVEQGLRLQVYDYQRRMGLIEASLDKLPRGLKVKLQSSATGMNSPEWDQHDRLTAQLSADQDAAAAAAAAASGTSTSRGRSHSRTSRSGTNDDGSRSRSRSFTLPLRGWGGGKGGGGGGGERRRRWSSQDSDTYQSGRADTDGYRASRADTDIEEESYGTMSNSGGGPWQHGSGDTTTTGGGQSLSQSQTPVEEEMEERPVRTKTLFGFGRWGNGGRLRSTSSAQASALAPTAGDSGDEDTAPGSGGGGSGQAATGEDVGGGGRRRQSSSAAYTLRGAVGGGQRSDSVRSRNDRFSSFTGERPSVAPTTGSPGPEDPKPDEDTQQQQRGGGRGGRLQRSQSMVDTGSSEDAAEPTSRWFGKKNGWARSSSKAARRASDEGLESRHRTMSASADVAAPPSETPHRGYLRATPDSKATPSKGRWRGRGRATSSAGIDEDDEDQNMGPRRRALSTAGTGYGGGLLGATPDSRSKSTSAVTPGRRGTAGGDVGGGKGGKPKKRVFGRTKGVWGSLQRTFAGGGSSSKQTPEAADGWAGGSQRRAQRQTPTPTRVKGGGAATTPVLRSISRSGSAKKKAALSASASAPAKRGGEEAKTRSGEDGHGEGEVVEEATASAQRVATLLKVEEEAEAARREMQHTILTLEIQLLVKDIVDTACLRASERVSEKSSDRSSLRSNQSSLKWAPLSVSSSVAPEPLPRLSASAVQGESRNFFEKFWSGHTGSGGENNSDLVNGDREGAGGGGGLGGARGGGGIAGHWGGFDRDGARRQRRHSDAGPAEPQAAAAAAAAAIWMSGEGRDAAAAPDEKADEAGKDGGGSEEQEGFFQALARKIFEGDRQDRDKAKSASQTKGAGGSTAKGQTLPSQGSKKAAAKPSEMQTSLRLTPVRTAERSTAQRGVPSVGVNGGSGARATPSRSRSRSMAGTGAGAGAGPGTGGYSPIITIPPLPMADGAPTSSTDPDAGAGGTRSVESSVDPSTAEAAAAKFGLVRMDYGGP